MTKSIRTLLVDDESPARDRLRMLLKPFEQILIVGEATNGEEAIEQIERLSPDLVFLDIQMPVCGGLEVAASLKAPRPRIIFCTAYDQYAVDAFELNAVDYLLKPVSRVRLGRAIERVRLDDGRRLESGLDEVVKSGPTSPTRFLAKRGSRFCVIPRGGVLFFLSEHGLTYLVSRDRKYLMQPTLGELEGRLDPVEFFRISRSVIVRLAEVREVLPLIGGHGAVVLSNGAHLDVSRRRFKDLLDQLDQTSGR